MSKHEVREQQINEWLEHLRCCEAAGGSVASYARQHGIAEWKLYQWRSRLVRDGQWPATAAAPKSPGKVVPVRFARVAVASPAPAYVVRLQLGNGRRAEIEMAYLDPLVHLIGALERQP